MLHIKLVHKPPLSSACLPSSVVELLFLSLCQGLNALFVSTSLLHVRGKKKRKEIHILLMIFPPYEGLESNSLLTAQTQAQLFHCSRCPFSNYVHRGKMPMFFCVSLFKGCRPVIPDIAKTSFKFCRNKLFFLESLDNSPEPECFACHQKLE